jgi:hypothetical protein
LMIVRLVRRALELKGGDRGFHYVRQQDGDGADRGMTRLAGCRGELYCSLGMRRDDPFEACDAPPCRR